MYYSTSPGVLYLDRETKPKKYMLKSRQMDILDAWKEVLRCVNNCFSKRLSMYLLSTHIGVFQPLRVACLKYIFKKKIRPLLRGIFFRYLRG